MLIVDLRVLLICLSSLNDLSAVHEVTGKMQRIVTRALMLGNKLEIRGEVEVSADGSEAEPCSSPDFHLMYQLCISLLREEIFGWSPEYSSPQTYQLFTSHGTKYRPWKAVFKCEVNILSSSTRRWSKSVILMMLLKYSEGLEAGVLAL